MPVYQTSIFIVSGMIIFGAELKIGTSVALNLFLSILNVLSRNWFSVINPRPSQHGVDLLSLLSKLLDQNIKPGEAGNDPSVVVVSLALNALQELCNAEVICCMNRHGTFSSRDIFDKHECLGFHLPKKICLIPPRDFSMVNSKTCNVYDLYIFI